MYVHKCMCLTLAKRYYKEIQPVYPKGDHGCSLEGLMLKLKLQYFGHLMGRADWLKKTLMIGRIGGRKRRGWQRMRWLDGITDSMTWVWVNSRSWRWTGRPGVLRFMRSQRVRRNWTELNRTIISLPLRVEGSDPRTWTWVNHMPREQVFHSKWNYGALETVNSLDSDHRLNIWPFSFRLDQRLAAQTHLLPQHPGSSSVGHSIFFTKKIQLPHS